MSHGAPDYDLAVSFAGEQRDYVEQVVEACKERGLRVLYDRDLAVELWGRNLIVEFRKAYGGKRTRYAAPFISKEYLDKGYPMDEFRAMLVPVLDNPDDFMLPVLVGDVTVPEELLSSAVGVLYSEEHTPEGLAHAFELRIKGSSSSSPPPPPRLRMPRPAGPPVGFDKHRELQVAFRYLAAQFENAAAQMSGTGFECRVQGSDSFQRIHIEQHGRALYSLGIRIGGMGRDDILNFTLSHREWESDVNRSNGTASVVFDRESGVPKLEMNDLSVLGTAPGTRLYTKEELFEALWDRIVDQVEQLADHSGEVPGSPSPRTGSVRQSGGGTFIANTGHVGGDITVRES